MFEDFEDPLTRLERIESVLARTVELLTQTVEKTNNNTWILNQMNQHVAELTTALNYLTDQVITLKNRLDKL